jgi:ABC-type transporter Mla subunit MlaD
MLFEQELNRIEHRALSIEQKVDKLMAAQDDINAAVTAINSFLTDLSTQVADIKAALAAGGGGTPADTSALNTAVGQLPAAQSAIDALAGTPAPPVTPQPPAGPSFR